MTKRRNIESVGIEGSDIGVDMLLEQLSYVEQMIKFREYGTKVQFAS